MLSFVHGGNIYDVVKERGERGETGDGSLSPKTASNMTQKNRPLSPGNCPPSP